MKKHVIDDTGRRNFEWLEIFS